MSKQLLWVIALIFFVGVLSWGAEPYKLSAGDVLDITVLGEPDLSKQVVVPPDGKITYPLIGEINAIGLTVQQLADEITRRLKEYIKKPSVSVSIVKFSYNKFYILGEIARPGEYDLLPGMGLREAISLAGGVTPQANINAILLLHKNGEREEVDLQKILAGERDVPLNPADVIVVPKATVSVIGEVKTPGEVVLLPGLKIKEIIARCGGLTENADPSKVVVTRAGRSFAVDITTSEGEAFSLQPGDIIHVPRGEIKVVIIGEVAKPGIYDVPSINNHLVEVLSLAGGLRTTAEEKRITITRKGSEENQRIIIDLRRASAGDPTQNIEVKSGDIIFVPAKKQIEWSRYLPVFSILYYITVITRR